MYKHLVSLLVLLTLLVVPLAYAGFDEGKAAYDRGDYATAYKEFKALTDQGNARAQSYMGKMYHEGQGVPQSYVEAAKWFRKAAEQGDDYGQYSMAVMYRDGQGMPQDYAEAVRWFRKAAEKGYASAQFNLGAFYANGQGVTQDYVQAHMWFNLSAAQGNRDAQKYRDALAKLMTPSQISEAQRLVKEWKPKGKD